MTLPPPQVSAVAGSAGFSSARPALVVQLALGWPRSCCCCSHPTCDRPTRTASSSIRRWWQCCAGRARNRRRSAARGRPRAGRRALRRAEPTVHQSPALRDRLSDGPHRTVGAPATAAGRAHRCRNDFGRRHSGCPAGRRADAAGGPAPAGTGGRPRPGSAQDHRPGLPDRGVHAHRRLRAVRVGHPKPNLRATKGAVARSVLRRATLDDRRLLAGTSRREVTWAKLYLILYLPGVVWATWYLVEFGIPTIRRITDLSVGAITADGLLSGAGLSGAAAPALCFGPLGWTDSESVSHPLDLYNSAYYGCSIFIKLLDNQVGPSFHQ